MGVLQSQLESKNTSSILGRGDILPDRLNHSMSFLDRFLQTFRPTAVVPAMIPVDPGLMARLEGIAAQEEKTAVQVARELLDYAIVERQTAVAHLRLWEELTPREKQTAALACLGHTNTEIGEQMIISTNTVKTHMRNILGKFNVKSKTELRAVLAGWDFSGWAEEQNLLPDDDAPPINSDSSNGVNS